MSPLRLKGTAGPVINQAWPLEGRLLIGGAPGCDIALAALGEGSPLVEVRVDAEHGVRVRRLADGAPVSLNGERIEAAEMRPGDELRIGSCAFLLQAPGRRPERVLASATPRKPGAPAWLWVALALALAGAGLAAWHRGLLPF